jgi:hypothetical protein
MRVVSSSTKFTEGLRVISLEQFRLQLGGRFAVAKGDRLPTPGILRSEIIE